MNGLLMGRSVYLAHPIDLCGVEDARDAVVQAALDLLTREGAVVYDPARAFRVDPGVRPNPHIARVNDAALSSSDLMVACFPEAPGVGVAMEIARAAQLGVPAVVVTRAAAKSWTLAGLDPDLIHLASTLDFEAIRWLAQCPGRSCDQILPCRLERYELLPTHGYRDDAGFDLIVAADTEIEPGQFVDVSSGCAVQLPPGIWGMIVGRSSTLRKHGLLVNTGIIDTGWRGELFAGVWNMGQRTFTAKAGMRLAQLIPLPNLAAGLVPTKVHHLEPSDRGTNGFGSTGE